MKQFITEIPATTNFDALPEDTQAALKALDIINTMLVTGTTMESGNVLVLALTSSDKDTCQDKFTELGLDWTIRAFEGEPMDEAPMLGKFPDVVTQIPVMVDGVPGFIEDINPVTSLKGILHKFAGHKWQHN